MCGACAQPEPPDRAGRGQTPAPSRRRSDAQPDGRPDDAAEEARAPRTSFPGEELVEPGLADLAAGRRTVEALLVAAARPRLERVGVHLPEHRLDTSGRELYALLEAQLGNRAHSRYNALTRRLLSYCSARAQDARRRR